MQDRLVRLEGQAISELEGVEGEAGLQQWKVKYLGRSSELAEILDGLRKLPKDERPAVGKQANQLKARLEGAFAAREQTSRAASLEYSLQEDRLDVTLPGRTLVRGRLHPSTSTLRLIADIWAEMGFQVYRSRDVETDDYNFGLLNIPAHHPARDQWDTFYTKQEGVLLRTHTSPGQIRVMRERAPEPIRVILPGMCYRYEQITARSEIQFNQVEGLAVGRNITFADLKGTLNAFARRLYGEDVKTRLRAGHFPFTEPSAEMDIECFVCGGIGCAVCKGTGWLEILGSGMVHPTVLENGGYDPSVFSGFAFGMGPERITMNLHRIDDIRYFWSNDMRFLEQF
ncbi:MAG: phenylalanine--tRNA ligase subunit alpha [Chloroflexi bacterium RBG_19FT_COMBO_62_14]|nr:MAG: phenylalanine--tRNA ligase subunit alpha [Chloroflexi bacterium RBG_19FT_COMBO_62_14]